MKMDLKIKIKNLLENIKDFWQKYIDGYPDLETFMQ